MADLFETRCASEGLTRSDHVLRVACIGDSMIWGQGVPPCHTLPAHLSRILNAALPQDLVWVDNFGESSGNLWHAWTRMRARAAAGNFQAIVFSVCQNDSQIFESNLVEYELNKIPYWSEDGLHFKHVRRLFEEFSLFCKAKNIIAIVLFYTFIEEDQPIIASMSRLMTRLGLPFVDLLSYYRQETGLDIAAYIASEFDAHPSSRAHELAARRVARELVKHLSDSRGRRVVADMAQELPLALAELVEGQVSIDTALAWARDALDAKVRAVARQRGQGVALANDCRALLAGIAMCETAWRVARCAEANLLAAPSRHYRAVALPNLFQIIRNLEEVVFLIERSGDVSELAELGEAFVTGRYYDRDGHLDFFSGDAGSEIAAAQDRINRLKLQQLASLSERTSRLFGPGVRLREGLYPAAVSLDLAAIDGMVRRVAAQLTALDSAASRICRVIEPVEARPVWAMAFHLVRTALCYLEAIDETLLPAIPLGDVVGPPWTCVDVTLEGGPHRDIPTGICRLVAEVDYTVPSRIRVREVAWAGVARDHAIYHFELPLMILGDLRVGVLENEPTRLRFLDGATRISRVRIYNQPPQVALAVAGEHGPTLEWCDAENRLPMLEFRGLRLR
jgi:hypothetical protein